MRRCTFRKSVVGLHERIRYTIIPLIYIASPPIHCSPPIYSHPIYSSHLSTCIFPLVTSIYPPSLLSILFSLFFLLFFQISSPSYLILLPLQLPLIKLYLLFFPLKLPSSNLLCIFSIPSYSVLFPSYLSSSPPIYAPPLLSILHVPLCTLLSVPILSYLSLFLCSYPLPLPVAALRGLGWGQGGGANAPRFFVAPPEKKIRSFLTQISLNYPLFRYFSSKNLNEIQLLAKISIF